MNLASLIILIIILGFVLVGFASGFILTLGNLIGLIISAFVAAHYYHSLAEIIDPYMWGEEKIAQIISFIFIFLVASRIIGIIIWFLAKISKIIFIIPFTKLVDRLLGAFLGLIEGMIFVGVVQEIIRNFIPESSFTHFILSSSWSSFFIKLSKFFTPFLEKIIPFS